MKVIVIGTVGLPACYGGFESLVENINLNRSENINYQIFCSSKAYRNKLKEYHGSELIYLPLSANGSQSILYDIVSMIRAIYEKPDVVLILGVSGCIFLPIFKLLSKARVITNIDGLEWRRDKWAFWIKKFLKFSEMIAVKYSDAVITDNEAITEYVKSEYDVDSKTIAYGGDHALRVHMPHEKEKGSFALGICRIEPENNVELILESFSKLSIQLKFVGNWDNSEFGKNLKAKYSRYENLTLIDPIYDLDELYKLRSSCSIYLHGHSAGGTNPSLVEMMHFGCPIFAFDCSFNRFTTDNKAHYFKDFQDLGFLVNSVTSEELKLNGKYMLQLAKNKYTWCRITKLYEYIYQV